MSQTPAPAASAPAGATVDAADARLRERFDLIVNGPALFNALLTGLELGVFALLGEGPAGMGAVRGRTGLGAHQADVLMQALCSTELVRFADGCYTATPTAADLLIEQGPDRWLPTLRGWREIYYPAFASSTQALKAGTNTALAAIPGTGQTLYERLSADPGREAVLHACMSAFTMCSMQGLLENLDLAPGQHLLDIGGGDGTTARQIARAFPGVTVTVFDLPSVAARGLRPQDGSGTAQGPVSYVGGDLFDDPFPREADAVLFSHCLEVLSPESISLLITKAGASLKPGGRLFIYGYTPSSEGHGVYSARLSLYLTVLATGQGRAYPAHVYEGILASAGLSQVVTVAGLPYEHSLMCATKADTRASDTQTDE